MAENPSTTNLVFEAIRAELRPPNPAAMICLTRTQARAVLAERDELLEALKRMYAAWNRKAPMPREDADELEIISRAAIAKAEGR